MKIAAIIAEYNPFHNGHAYQIREVKKRAGADALIVLMSGNFVQRGEPAILDKYTRTRLALEGGANLVLELPAANATGSAGEFAYGAVRILDALGCVDELWFGGETEEILPLDLTASVLAEEPPVFRTRLQAALRNGYSYPLAQELALRHVLGYEQSEKKQEALHALLFAPNNMLGISYMTELKRIQSRIEPRILKRQGEGYHSLSLSGIFASASGIREAVREGRWEETKGYVPSFTLEALQNENFIELNDFSPILFYRLLQEEDLSDFAGVSADLANRIRKYAPDCNDITELTACLKSKNWTYSRLSRALLHIVLGIRTNDFRKRRNAVRILGHREAAAVFSRIKQKGRILLSASPAAMRAEEFVQEVSASDIYERIRSYKAKISFLSEYKRMPVK